jgi:hypothetical protein
MKKPILLLVVVISLVVAIKATNTPPQKHEIRARYTFFN